jgi:hypothetical protein
MVENSWSEILLDKTIPSKITRKIMLFHIEKNFIFRRSGKISQPAKEDKTSEKPRLCYKNKSKKKFLFKRAYNTSLNKGHPVRISESKFIPVDYQIFNNGNIK